MTCTNFPKDNLVPNVTQHQVGNVTYLYKGGAPTAPLWEAITPPINLDQVHRRVTTVANVAAGSYEVGSKLMITDAGNSSLFDVVDGAVTAGDLPAGANKRAVLVGRNYNRKPKDLSGLLSLDGKRVVITGDSLSYNRYGYMNESASNAYNCLHGIRSWSFLLRDYIHMNDSGFNYGDALMGVAADGMLTSDNHANWVYGFNNRALLLNPSSPTSAYAFKMADLNISTSKLYLHIARKPTVPCQFDVLLDSGSGDVFVKTVELPVSTRYKGYDPIVVEIPYTPETPNWYPRVTLTNWAAIGGGAFVSGGCALMGVGTKHTPVYMTGEGGRTATQIAADYHNKIGQYAPDVLICIAGANDRFYGNTATYEAGYRSIIEQTRATNPDCEIVLLSAMPATDAGYYPETAVLNGEMMRDFLYVTEKLAMEYDCIHVDNYRAMAAGYTDSLIDNVHLNRNGNTRLFRIMCGEIMAGAIGNKSHLDGWSTYGGATRLPVIARAQQTTQSQIYPKGDILFTMSGGEWRYTIESGDPFGIVNSVSQPTSGWLKINTNYMPARDYNTPHGLIAHVEQYGSGNKVILARLYSYTSSSFTFICTDPATGAVYRAAQLEGNSVRVVFS